MKAGDDLFADVRGQKLDAALACSDVVQMPFRPGDIEAEEALHAAAAERGLAASTVNTDGRYDVVQFERPKPQRKK